MIFRYGIDEREFYPEYLVSIVPDYLYVIETFQNIHF